MIKNNQNSIQTESISGLTAIDLKEQGKENVITFSRKLTEKERKTIKNILKEANTTLRSWEQSGRTNERLYQEYNQNLSALLNYTKEKNLEIHITQKKIQTKIIEIPLRKTHQKNKSHEFEGSLTDFTDGDFEDQNEECLLISGKFSYHDLQKLKRFKNKMYELDQQIDIAENLPFEAEGTVKLNGLMQQYHDCQNEIIGYLQLNTKATIQKIPKKDMKKSINRIKYNINNEKLKKTEKELYQEKEKIKNKSLICRKEHTKGRVRELERKYDEEKRNS